MDPEDVFPIEHGAPFQPAGCSFYQRVVVLLMPWKGMCYYFASFFRSGSPGCWHHGLHGSWNLRQCEGGVRSTDRCLGVRCYPHVDGDSPGVGILTTSLLGSRWRWRIWMWSGLLCTLGACNFCVGDDDGGFEQKNRLSLRNGMKMKIMEVLDIILLLFFSSVHLNFWMFFSEAQCLQRPGALESFVDSWPAGSRLDSGQGGSQKFRWFLKDWKMGENLHSAGWNHGKSKGVPPPKK